MEKARVINKIIVILLVSFFSVSVFAANANKVKDEYLKKSYQCQREEALSLIDESLAKRKYNGAGRGILLFYRAVALFDLNDKEKLDSAYTDYADWLKKADKKRYKDADVDMVILGKNVFKTVGVMRHERKKQGQHVICKK